MTKKQDQNKEMFVVGFDVDGKPRGGQFDASNEKVVNAALDLGLTAVTSASPEFGTNAKKLPPGRLYASGKAFIPNIKEALLTELMGILRKPGDTSEAYRLDKEPARLGPNEAGQPPVRCKSPVISGLPRNWDEIEEGHLVIVEESTEDGSWPAIVQNRDGDLLTLRYRDAPKLPAFVRHVTTVALLNPGPLAAK